MEVRLTIFEANGQAYILFAGITSDLHPLAFLLLLSIHGAPAGGQVGS